MRIFHRHLATLFLRNLGAAVLVFAAVESAALGTGSTRGLPAILLTALNDALPLALLVAVLFTLGPMTRDHEITALRMAGRPLAQITRPLLLAALVATAVSALLTGGGFTRVVPTGAEAGAGAAIETWTEAARRTADHARLAHPWTCLVAVLVGIGFGAGPRRKTRFTGFLTAGGVLLAFHVLTAVFHALGRHGGLPPAVAGWAPLALSAGAALVLFRRAEI